MISIFITNSYSTFLFFNKATNNNKIPIFIVFYYFFLKRIKKMETELSKICPEDDNQQLIFLIQSPWHIINCLYNLFYCISPNQQFRRLPLLYNLFIQFNKILRVRYMKSTSGETPKNRTLKTENYFYFKNSNICWFSTSILLTPESKQI